MDLEPLSGPAVYPFPNHGLTARLRLCRLAAFLLLAPSILPGVEARVRLEVVRRDVLISNPGTYKIPDEQLHYPYLYESTNGRWYLTYREGPHREAQWGPGNREQCVQSGDRGKTWLPWMGMRPELLYQFFVTRLRDGSLVSYRHKMTGLAKSEDGTIQGTQFILRSKDEGAAWSRHLVPVTNLPFTLGSVLVFFWGPALEMPDGRLLWPVYSREGRTRYPYGVALGSILGITESTDGGSSFRWIASMCDDVTVGQHREPGLVRLPSGELLAVIRTGTFPSDDNVMVQVRSSDGGYTWSPPRRLARPGVCPQVLLLDNGVLVCSYGSRRYLHVMASWDGGGRDWSEPLILYEGQTSGYSNVQTLGPDHFRIVYQEGTFDAFQEGGNRIVRVEIKATPASGSFRARNAF